jgi:hypothetical protein
LSEASGAWERDRPLGTHVSIRHAQPDDAEATHRILIPLLGIVICEVSENVVVAAHAYPLGGSTTKAIEANRRREV